MTSADLVSIEEHYGPDMPDREGFQYEVEVWKTHCAAHEQVGSVIEALLLADSEFFPNVHEIFKLILTLPIGTVPCERSFSAMRRLKDWSRSTMKENRLCGLALLYIHRDMDVSRENIIKSYDSTGHWRIGQLKI